MLLKYTHVFFAFSFFTIFLLVHASENIFIDQEIQHALIEKIRSMEDGQFIGCAMFCFTDQKIVKALCEAKKRRVIVRVCIGDRLMGLESQKVAIDTLRGSGIKIIVVDDLHVKMWLFADADPSFGVISNPVAYLGSANATNNAYRNHEISIRSVAAEFFCSQYNKFFLELGEECIYLKADSCSTPVKSKKLCGLISRSPTNTTPPSGTVISSKEVNLNRVIASRITDTGSKKTVCGMMITDDTMVDALKCAGESAQLVVDKQQLTSEKGRNILTELEEAGVGVRVHMGSDRGYLHAKAMTRSAESSHGELAIISTANFTDMGVKEINGLVVTRSRGECVKTKEFVTKMFDEAKPLTEISPTKMEALKASRKRGDKGGGDKKNSSYSKKKKN